MVSHESLVIGLEFLDCFVVRHVVLHVHVGVILDLFLDLVVLSGGDSLVEVVLLSLASFDNLSMVLECLISGLKESQLVVAILDGSVEHIYADFVTLFL